MQLSQKDKNEWYQKSLLGVPDFSRFTGGDVIELIGKTIPEKYINTFIRYTEIDPDVNSDILRIFLLGIGKHESHWIKTRSNNANKDGSYDRGYLMLNDGNIKNKRFMSIFSPIEAYPAQDDIELYLTACIRYYTYLFKRYGYEDSIYIYNAGEGRYLNDSIPISAYWYKYRVKNCISEYLEDLYEISSGNKRRMIQEKTIIRLEEIKRIVEEKENNACQSAILPIQIEKSNNKGVFIQRYYIIPVKRKRINI
jgi:hypothetical protein